MEHVDLLSRKIRSFEMLVAYAASDKATPPETLDMAELDHSREIYLPWASRFDLWRTRRALARHTTWVEKAHMLPPMLRNGTWAIIPSFLAESLKKDTGCTIHRIGIDPPELLPLFVVMRKRGTDTTTNQRRLVESALVTIAQR